MYVSSRSERGLTLEGRVALVEGWRGEEKAIWTFWTAGFSVGSFWLELAGSLLPAGVRNSFWLALVMVWLLDDEIFSLPSISSQNVCVTVIFEKPKKGGFS